MERWSPMAKPAGAPALSRGAGLGGWGVKVSEFLQGAGCTSVSWSLTCPQPTLLVPQHTLPQEVGVSSISR